MLSVAFELNFLFSSREMNSIQYDRISYGNKNAFFILHYYHRQWPNLFERKIKIWILWIKKKRRKRWKKNTKNNVQFVWFTANWISIRCRCVLLYSCICVCVWNWIFYIYFLLIMVKTCRNLLYTHTHTNKQLIYW